MGRNVNDSGVATKVRVGSMGKYEPMWLDILDIAPIGILAGIGYLAYHVVHGRQLSIRLDIIELIAGTALSAFISIMIALPLVAGGVDLLIAIPLSVLIGSMGEKGYVLITGIIQAKLRGADEKDSNTKG